MSGSGRGLVWVWMLSSLDDVSVWVGDNNAAFLCPRILTSESTAAPRLCSKSVSHSCPRPHLQGGRTDQQTWRCRSSPSEWQRSLLFFFLLVILQNLQVQSPVDALHQQASVYQENHRQLSSLSVKLVWSWQQRGERPQALCWL